MVKEGGLARRVMVCSDYYHSEGSGLGASMDQGQKRRLVSHDNVAKAPQLGSY